MINKHFLKVVLLFAFIIFLGIASSFLVSYFDSSDMVANPVDVSGVAK